MNRIKQLLKRGAALSMAVLMAVGMLPLDVAAADGTVKIYEEEVYNEGGDILNPFDGKLKIGISSDKKVASVEDNGTVCGNNDFYWDVNINNADSIFVGKSQEEVEAMTERPDVVSGATISWKAIRNGVLEAFREDAAASSGITCPTQPLDLEKWKAYRNQNKKRYTVLKVPVHFYNATKEAYSIGDGGLVSEAYVMLFPGTSTTKDIEIRLQFKEMSFGGASSGISSLYYFSSKEDMDKWNNNVDKSTIKDVLVDSVDSSGNLKQVSFVLPSKDSVVWMSGKVPAMGNQTPVMRLGIDWDNATAVEGKDLLNYFISTFKDNLNKDYYADTYAPYYESHLYDAQEVASAEDATDTDITTAIQNLSVDYQNRTRYLKQKIVLQSVDKYLAAAQEDFSDESWQFLQDEAVEAKDWLSGNEWTYKDVTEYDNRLKEAARKLQVKEGLVPYSTRVRELLYETKLYKSADYLEASLTFLPYTTQYVERDIKGADEFVCREQLKKLETAIKSYIFKKRVVIGNGTYTVKAIPYVKAGDAYEETDILKDYVDLDNIKMVISNNRPTFTFSTNQKSKDTQELPAAHFSTAQMKIYEAQNYGAVSNVTTFTKEIGDRTVYFATSLEVRMPDQVDRDHMYLEGSIYNNIDGTKEDFKVYLDVDYENAQTVETPPETTVDKSKLKEILDTYAEDTVDGLVSMGYTKESVQNWIDGLTAAKKVYRSSKSTQAEINQQVNKLNNLEASLIKYSKLYDNALQSAKEILSVSANRSKFTDESVANLQSVYNESKKVSKLENPANEDYDKAAKALNEAMDSLSPVTGDWADKTDLKYYIDAANNLSADIYTQDSYQAMLDTLQEANAVYEDHKASQTKVDSQCLSMYAAIKALQERGEGDVNTAGLLAEIAKAKALNEADYTVDSWKTLQEVLSEAEGILTKEGLTQDEVSDATQKVKDAVDALQKAVTEADKDALNNKIAEAEAKAQEEGYTAESYQALQTAIAAAKSVAENEAATQEEVNAQVDALDAAIQAMVEDKPSGELQDGTYQLPVSLWKAASDGASVGNGAVDGPGRLVVEDGMGTLYITLQKMENVGAEGYLAELNLMENIQFNDNGYPEKYDKVPSTVVSTFEGVYDTYNDPDKGTDTKWKGKLYPREISIPVDIQSQQEYLWGHVYVPVMNALSAGMGDQELRIKLGWSELKAEEGDAKVDISRLEAKLEEAKAVEGKEYTVDSYQALQSAITAAEAVLGKADATQEEVDAQEAALTAALKALIKETPETVDKSGLNEQIQKAEKLKETDYTKDSWSTLEEALEMAKEANDNEEATQAEVKEAKDKLETAIKSLVSRTLDKDNLEDGKYELEVHLWHASKNQASIGDAALNHTGLLEVKDGVYTLTVSGHPITMGSITASLVSMEIQQADGSYQAAKVTASDIEGGKPSQFQFVLPSKEEYIPVKIDPEVEAMGGAVEARLKLGWSTLKSVDDDTKVDDNVENEVVKGQGDDGNGGDDTTNGTNSGTNNGTNTAKTGTGSAGTGTTSGGGTSTGSGSAAKGTQASSVKTGDETKVAATIFLCAGALGAGAMLLRRKRELR